MNRLAHLTALLLLAACAPDAAPPPVAAQPEDSLVEDPVNTAAPPPAASPPAAPTMAEAPALAIDGEGLRLFNPANGAARPLPFGTARSIVLTALAGRGVPDLGTQTECGAGPLDFATWRDGLKLYFQADKFTGWAIDRGATRAVTTPRAVTIPRTVTAPRTLTTVSGIGLGSSRAELDAAYAIAVVQSTLGTEFTAGGLAGLLDGPGPRAKITNLWAGTSCNFR